MSKTPIQFRWLLKMALRDSKRGRARLLLFMSAIVLGVAALVSIFSLGDNVQKDLDAQAKELAGADLIVDTNRPPSASALQLLDSIGTQRAREASFASMVYFTQSKGTRLVQVRALEEGYPFYGSFQTAPANAGKTFRKKQAALVDQTLLLQFNAKPGDTIQVGNLFFEIEGALEQAPGRTGLSNTVAPPVYIPYQYLEATGLLQKGSRVSYNFYFKFNGNNLAQQLPTLEPRFEQEGLDFETSDSRKAETAREFNDLSSFLTLISFIALLLGCIGVASSIHIYIREKITSIAILRCLGASGKQTFLIFLLQVAAIGLAGALAGCALGTLVQQGLPYLLKDILPLQLTPSISWPAIGKGLLTGLFIALLFGIMPLLSIRNISPLYTLRISNEDKPGWRDPLKWLLYLLIFLFITVFTWWQTGNMVSALLFTTGILVAFLLLVALAWLLRAAVKRFLPHQLAYVWRQGFANLYRPNNQTLILVVTIGLGTAFIGTLYFVQHILVNRVALSSSGKQPNIVLFDIQPSQREAIADLAKNFQLPVQQQVPIVTMRVETVNGRNALQAKSDTTEGTPARAFEGELRVTYRDTLTDSEKLLKGKMGAKVNGPNDPVLVSLEDRYAKRLRVSVGDSITFNVQGMLVKTIVGSIRQVNWQRVQTNFRAIFPPGVLEAAPQFHVLISRVPSREVSAKFQQAVVARFPNVSIIDLNLILEVLDEVLGKIGFVVRFMAAFSILTGLIVLIASVFISKYQRVQESVLLRTLGASRKQIGQITALEYFFLGALAAATGLGLATAASWALAVYMFDAPFSPSIFPVLIIFFSISGLTALIGWLNSRDVVRKPPLEVLRRE